MNTHARRLSEDAGIRRAKGLLDAYKDHKSVQRPAVRAMLDTLAHDVVRSGRNRKAAARIQKRLMQANECIRAARLQAGRSGWVIEIDVFLIGRSARLDADGVEFEEPAFLLDRYDIRMPVRSEARVTILRSAVTLHALARILGRLPDLDASQALSDAVEACTAIFDQTVEAHASGNWHPWQSFPVPFKGGLLIVEVGTSDPARNHTALQFEARTFIDEGLLHPDQIALRDHLIADGLEALHHYPDHVT